MQGKRRYLLLVVLCTLVLASAISGVPSAAASSHVQPRWATASLVDQALDAPPTQEPPPDPGGTPPDDNWDGVTPVLAAPQEAEPAAPLADRNLDPDAPVSETPPTPALPLAPPDDNWDGAAPDGAAPGRGDSQPTAASESLLFPATGDTISVLANPYWWHLGDYAQGVRTPGLNSVAAVKYDLTITNNVLSGAGFVNLDLIINGVVVGNFSVLPGQTSRSVTFFFAPIGGPNYTIRLRETNTVVSGAGSIVIPLDTSRITLYDSTTRAFPATGDTINVQFNPYWWHAGDYAQGVRTPGLNSVTGVRYDLAITNNVLSGTGRVDLELSINGVVVGNFTVLPGQTSKSVTFFFAPISGPNYTIRLRETNTVDPGAGSIVIPLDTSPITFYDSTTSPFFPATGDVVSVQFNPYWWHAGDYAQGVRVPGLGSVTALKYDLTITNNVLNSTGHVDLELSINGIVVGSFTVLPGQTSRSLAFLFPRISGPSYTIRLRETNTVDPGAGSIVIPLDVSRLTLIPPSFLPLVLK